MYKNSLKNTTNIDFGIDFLVLVFYLTWGDWQENINWYCLVDKSIKEEDNTNGPLGLSQR